jgi:hypothetical protein
MHDSHFESGLRALRPAAPPAALEERIAAGLSCPEPTPAGKAREPVSIRFEQAREPLLVRCFHSLGWAIAGAASAVAAIALYPAKPAPEKLEPPSARMAARVESRNVSEKRDLRSQSPARTDSPATPVSAVPIAASLPAGSGETGDFQPMETTRELISSEEESQLLYRDGSSPMRRVHNRYRERHTWTNPRTGARMDIEVPREDVFLQPVSLQ